MMGETATPNQPTATAGGPELFAAIAGILREITGQDADQAARIAPNSTLEGDLGLESMELAELGDRLRAEFGAHVDLAGLVAGLDIDELIGLTVADVVAHVAGTR
jgi:acyl carrier protein